MISVLIVNKKDLNMLNGFLLMHHYYISPSHIYKVQQH